MAVVASAAAAAAAATALWGASAVICRKKWLTFSPALADIFAGCRGCRGNGGWGFGLGERVRVSGLML
ncbi:hypothetical protein L1049_012296 [Liquidambar formosana]|uniref:Uncharacterized protein n=1 Tax=Liquidambar formosana TaxID=63359 RepID=A0AAP0X0E9_LIQFO